MRSEAPTVVFIAGSGRSGSTLAERMLGGISGYVNVGELIDIFRRVYDGDELCGCGERFSRCAFWREVGERAFGGWSGEIVAETAGLQSQVARQRHIPHLLSHVQHQRFQDSLRTYQSRYAKLYQAIALTADAQVVVDASKWPAQALALSGAGLDLRVINVVRDVRGVAWSMNKRDLVRPHATGGREIMFHQGTAAAGARWAVCQSEVNLLRFKGTPTVRLPYEDLVTRALPAIRQTLDRLRLSVTHEELHHIGPHEADLGTSHGLSGNPSRFTAGVTPLRLDEEWRTEMPRASQALLGMIGMPQRIVARLSHGISQSTERAVVEGS